MSTNKKIMHFINGEKQAQRLDSYHLDTRNDTGMARTEAILMYKSLRMGQDAAGALHGMGCHIHKQDIDPVSKMFLLTIGMPNVVTMDTDQCEACRGTGTFNGEQCWHCEGEGIDPTF